MIDDRLILLPLCRKHFITRQDKLTPGFIELTLKAQPSSKLVAFSCGLRCKRHALIFTVESIVVVGSFVANAFIQVVLEAVHAGMFQFFFRPAAVLAGFCHFTLINTLNARCPLRTAGNFIGIVLLTIGIGVRLHLAVCPDQIAVQIHIRIASVVFCFIAKTEQLRAGHCIPNCGCINVRIVDVDDVLIGTHVAVVDLQHLLTQTGGIHGAVVKVNRNVMFSCTVIRVNIDYFSLCTICIKGAGIKYHGRGAIRPERIIIFWSIEGRISEHCTGITPVGGPAVDFAVIHHCIINVGKAKIIFTAGAKLHIFEGDRSGPLKAVIGVIFCAKKRRVRHRRTDLPGRFVSSLPHKGQVFSPGRFIAFDTVQRIIALAKDDSITAICLSHSSFQRRIALIILIFVPCYWGAGCVIRKSQHGKHLKHHCHCQQGRQKPVLTFLFQLSSFLSSLFAFLQRIPRKEPSRFLPHCHLPCRFHSPHCRSQPGC